jgi:tetratricopeptide (TPR) repeat protein
VIGSCKPNRPVRHWVLLPAHTVCGILLLASISAFAADGAGAIRTAAALVEQGRLDAAERQARLGLNDPRTRAAAYTILGTIRLQQQRIPESITLFQHAIGLDPRLIGARLSLAAAFTAQGNDAAAVKTYGQVLEVDRSNEQARFALAKYESDSGNPRQSLALIKPILAELKKSPEGLLLLTSNYLKLNDQTAAAALVKDWIHLPNVPAESSVMFALLIGNGGLTNEAVDVLESAQKAGQHSYELAFNLASFYRLNQNPALALDQYDAALAMRPDSLPALREAAIVAEGQEHLERSLSYWMRAKKVAPADPDILFGFGRVCLKMDLLEDAELALTEAARLKPEDLSYQYLLGSTKVGKKDFDSARSIFEKLIAKRPQDSQLHYAMGSVLYLQGHLADALQQFLESTKLQPSQLASYYYVALIARDQGNQTEAMARLEKLIQQHPDHAPSREALGELQMGAQRYAEAEANLQKAIQLDPKSVKANYQLGLLLSRMGKKEDADKQLEVAKSLRIQDQENSRLQLRLLDPNQ